MLALKVKTPKELDSFGVLGIRLKNSLTTERSIAPQRINLSS